MADYYAFSSFTAEVGGQSLTVTGKPGVWSWDRLNPGTRALLEVAEVHRDDRVLDLGCGTGSIGLWAASHGARTVLVDVSLPAVESARHTVGSVSCPPPRVVLSDGVAALGNESFDLVLCHLPRGRSVQEELIEGAASALRRGGAFYFVASTRSGIKGAFRYARDRFGQCGVVRQKQGYHVGLAERADAVKVAPPAVPHTVRQVAHRGHKLKVAGKPGVFAWDRLDDGTAALIDAMEVLPHDRVLDLGCGTGIAGLVAATRATQGTVVLVDADVRAVAAARLTLEANDVRNGIAMVSDCAQAVRGQRFELVVTNPPFHRGVGTEYDVAYQFVRDAKSVLVRGGRLFLVANRHLKYLDHVRAVFGCADTVFSDNRYQVLRAVAP